MSSTRKTIVAVTSELPWPLNTGGHIRSFHLMRSLAREFNFHLVTVASCEQTEARQPILDAGIQLHAVEVDHRSKIAEASRVLRSILQRTPYVMFNRHNRIELRREFERILRSTSPDVVYLDHLDSYAFRALLPDVPIVADLHNVYSMLAERVANERRWPTSWYLSREAKLLATQEARLCHDADAVLAVSSQERDHFEKLGCRNALLVPNGVDCAAFASVRRSPLEQQPRILFLGALSWRPNAKAADFLAREVMPQVLEHRPAAVLEIVGRNPPAEILELGKRPNVEVHADVPTITPHLERANLMAVPLDSGGGTRLKILEAFAARVPVVSTPIGCEGIDCANQEHLWIANRSKFAECLVDALESPELNGMMVDRAHQLALSKYDWPMIGQVAVEAIDDLVGTQQVSREFCSPTL